MKGRAALETQFARNARVAPIGLAAMGSRMMRERAGLLHAALAAATGALLIAVLPLGGDAAAHLYRTALVEDGVVVWDTFWYAGHYPLASYSALYYVLAALVGNVPLALAATAGAAYLFTSLAARAWGDAGRWAALAYAVFAPAPLVLAQWPYAVGLVAALGSLRALQSSRPALGAAGAVLAFAFSPLAFLVLCLALAAVFVARPARTRRTFAVAGALAATTALAVAASLLFPFDLEAEFPPAQLVAAVGVAALGAAVAFRLPARDPLGPFFAVWGMAVIVVFLAPLPIGENLTRVRWLVFPLMLAAAALARFRPRWLVVPALAAGLAYTAVPYARFVDGALDSRSHTPAFWAPALEFLASRASPQFRVEVVPTAAHWEAYYLPASGEALARGWYRQLDRAENELFYANRIDPTAYRTWLRSRGVRYVVLSPARVDQDGAAAERRLLLSGRSGLVEIDGLPQWRIYELPDAAPILTGPGSPRLLAHEHRAIVGVTSSRGVHRLRVRYMPYWRIEGAVCLARASDGSTLVHVRAPGRFRLVARASFGDLLPAVVDRGSAACGKGASAQPRSR